MSTQIRAGEAFFFPPEPSMWAVRQTARRAAPDGAKPCPYIITRDEMVYPPVLDRLLSDPTELEGAASALGDAIRGYQNGRMRCVLLWESEREGLLLHRADTGLLCAYVPAPSDQEAKREHTWALLLASLAEQAADMPVFLTKELKPGRQNLREILRQLAEGLYG